MDVIEKVQFVHTFATYWFFIAWSSSILSGICFGWMAERPSRDRYFNGAAIAFGIVATLFCLRFFLALEAAPIDRLGTPFHLVAFLPLALGYLAWGVTHGYFEGKYLKKGPRLTAAKD